MQSQRLSILFTVIFSACCLFQPPAWATVYTWDGEGGNDHWDNAANWDTNSVPASHWNTQVRIDNNLPAPSAVKIYYPGYYTMNGLTITSYDSLTLVAQGLSKAILRFEDSSTAVKPFIDNSGTIAINNNELWAITPLTISGSGEITLKDGGYIRANYNSKIIQEAGHTIKGDGAISGEKEYGATQGYVDNHGRIIATNYGTGTLRFWGAVNNLTDGALEASPGATLELGRWSTSFYALQYTRVTGGRIDPKEGRVNLVYGEFKNLTLGAGQIDITGQYNNPLVGSITLDPGANLTLKGVTVPVNADGSNLPRITNNGTITLDGSFGDSKLQFAAPTTLEGNGQVIIAKQGSLNTGLTGTVTVTNESPHTIKGAGAINVPITNRGTITADGNYSPSKTLNIQQALTNDTPGTLSAVNGGILLASQPITGNGSVLGDGGKLDLQADLTAKNLTLTALADTAINVATGKTVELAGDFLNGMQDGSKWSWGTGSVLKMTGDDTWHLLEAGGSNFPLQTLNIWGDIALVDLYDNTPGEDVEALYVNSLIFGGSTLNLNGTDLYINGVLLDLNNLPTEYVGHVIDQPLAPVPPGLLLFGSGLLGLAGWRRFRKS